MNKWWLDQDNERYWLESTDRKDIGADLYAPIYDDSGKENWRYTLLRALNIGDVVFHYYKPHQAIISRSSVASLATETPVVWGAKTESARNRGTKPYRRPGLKVLLKDYEELSEFVPLEFIRANASGMQQSKKDLEDRYGKPIYAPIEFSLRRPPRMLQGYMFKLPADYVRILGLETNVSIETGLYNPYNNFGNAPQDDPVERQNRAIRERRVEHREARLDPDSFPLAQVEKLRDIYEICLGIKANNEKYLEPRWAHTVIGAAIFYGPKNGKVQRKGRSRESIKTGEIVEDHVYSRQQSGKFFIENDFENFEAFFEWYWNKASITVSVTKHENSKLAHYQGSSSAYAHDWLRTYRDAGVEIVLSDA